MTVSFRQAVAVRSPWILFVAIAILVLAIGAAAQFAMQHGLGWRCPALTLLHLPCPSCGSTRALSLLAQGNFRGALAFNPLIALSACAAPLIPFARFRAMLGRTGWAPLFAAILLNWIYLLFFLPR
jgi:hypothetical protein